MLSSDQSMEVLFFQPWSDCGKRRELIEGVPQSDPGFEVPRDLQPSIRGDQEVDPEAIPIFQPVL